MKKFILIFTVLLLAIAAVYAADKTVKSDQVFQNPGNVRVVSIGNDGAAYDTIFAGESNLYGPYRLSTSGNSPMYVGFKAYLPAGTMDAAGDTCSISYQVLGGTNILDTTTLWTVVDSVKGITADTTAYVDISSKLGSSIVFRLKNVTASDTTVLSDDIKVYFEENASVSYKK